jgi:hypothetical protein
MTGKRNNAQPDNSKENLPPLQPAMQQVMAVVVPEEIYNLMKEAIRKLPRDETDLLWTTMQSLRAQAVTMQMPGQMPPQG